MTNEYQFQLGFGVVYTWHVLDNYMNISDGRIDLKLDLANMSQKVYHREGSTKKYIWRTAVRSVALNLKFIQSFYSSLHN